MHSRALLAALAAAPLVAAQTIHITSNCEDSIYLWSVADQYNSDAPDFTFKPGSSYWSQPFASKSDGGGPSIKLNKQGSLFEGNDLAQIEYKLADNIVYYDLSLIDGDPFSDCNVAMRTSDPSCPTIFCGAGDTSCPNVYYHPDDPATLGCQGPHDIYVVLCEGDSPASSGSGSSGSASSGSASSGSSYSKSSAPPAPKPTEKAVVPTTPPKVAAPAPTSSKKPSIDDSFLEGQNDDKPADHVAIEWKTEVVVKTQVVHVPAPSGAPEQKREAHLHQHLGHSGMMGRHVHF